MTQEINSNRTIMRNTIFMYFRMIVTIVIGLYASRVIIRTLGIDGYGIYNIVGGVVVLFTFVSNALRNSTQRFLSFELGKNGNDIQKVFNSALQCHIYICICLFLFAETIGLWFTSTQLNIPHGQENTVKYVYQFSVITFLLQVIQVPYTSLIISNEKMGIYAYLSILEAILKLCILYFLIILPCNKVVLYSILVTVVTCIITIIFILYCHKRLGLKRFNRVSDYQQINDILGFSKWSMFSGCSNIISQQGGNYLINIFCGVAANASFGIANQVSNIIYGFVTNFQTAFQPQIVKRYASNDVHNLIPLMMRSSLMSYYLLLIVALPFCFEAQTVINLWLGIVPEYSTVFTILSLVFFLIDSIQSPLWMLIYSSGHIKRYTLVTGILTILNIPLSWFLLYYGYPIFFIFIVRIFFNLICSAYRIIYVNKYESFPISVYLKSVIVRSLIVTALCIIAIMFLKLFITQAILVIITSLLFIVSIILVIGFNQHDRDLIISMIVSKIPKL